MSLWILYASVNVRALLSVTAFLRTLTGQVNSYRMAVRGDANEIRNRHGASAQMSVPTAEKLPLHIKAFHGLGSVAYGVKDNGFATFLLLFYNQVVGLDARLVSLALTLAMVADAFADPLVGYFSDRTHTRWGRRLPWLYICAVPLGFAWMLLWVNPAGMGDGVFLYLLLTAFLVRVLVSAVEVPNAALIPELTRDYDERTAIMRFRYLFGWVGGLLMLFLAYDVFLVPSAEHPVGQLNPEGYWNYGVFGAILMVATVLLAALGQHKRVAHYPETRADNIHSKGAFGEIWEALSHPAALILFGGAAVAYVSQGITFSISNYLYIFVWRFSQIGFAIYPWVLMISVILSFFLVTPLVKRFGKKHVVIVSGLIGMCFWVAPFTLNYLGYWSTIGSNLSTGMVFAFAFCSNASSVMAMIAGQSMVADLVEASEVKTGKRAEGVFSAGWFFVQKCGVGFGILLSGLIVHWSGLPEKADPAAVPRAVVENMMLFYVFFVAVLAIAGAFVFRSFPINRDDHEERLRQLAQGKKSVEAPAQ
jgi:glycoside/pentoside/hexuronide:cation symporter, GPH family